jgi:hypothetical protein
MASFVLAKVGINYWGGRSGPSSCRKLQITEGENCYEMEESLELKPMKWHLGYATKASVEVSETATADFANYLSALKVLQAAKDEFAKAKQAFEESPGGKEFKKLLVPQTGPLPAEEVISEEDKAGLCKKIQEHVGSDYTVLKAHGSVRGYNVGMITVLLDKPILVSTISDITYKDYIWCSCDITTNQITFKTDMTTKLLFVKKGGYMYEPFRIEDEEEICQTTQRLMDEN